MAIDPAPRQLTVRLPDDVFDALVALATNEERTLSNALRVVARRYFEGVTHDDRNTPGGTEPARPAG